MSVHVSRVWRTLVVAGALVGLILAAALHFHTAESQALAVEPPSAPAKPIADAVKATAQLDLGPTLKPFLEKHPHSPGIVAAIVDGERISAIGAVGFRKAGAPEPFKEHDLIHLGSCTKAMTATLIGMLIEEHKLGFDTTMAEVFPDLRSKMNPQFAKVTIRELTRHLGGLPANLEWDKFNRPGKTLMEERRRAVEVALSRKPENTPGTKYVYSNLGFVILGAVVEAKTGRPWEEVIENRLFKPLDMRTAGFGPPGAPGKVDAPWGHVVKGNKLEPLQEDNPPVMGPAGRVHCSITDWAKFVRQYLDADARKKPLLRAETVHELVTPAKGQDYAGGWGINMRDWAGGEALSHSGSNTMWFCVVWAAPKRNFAVLVATNVAADDTEKMCDDITAKLIDLHAQRTKER